jgi:hypothetical protein
VNKKIDLPIIWDSKYEKMGVTPRELYMRQNGLCWLKPEISSTGEVNFYCTDGQEVALTNQMLNPTIECVKCMMGFTKKVMEDEIGPK